MLLDKSNIKIPLGKIAPMIDNVSYVVEINFSDLFAIGISNTFVGVFDFLFVAVGTRMFGFTNPVEVVARVGITLRESVSEGGQSLLNNYKTVIAFSGALVPTFW